MLTWHDVIGPLKETDYFRHALATVAQARRAGEVVFPADRDIFNAFKYTTFDKLKVVIVGQDPYHEPGQAMGLSFSVPPGVQVPPSLVNIYKELSTDVPGFTIPSHGCLIPWARQGVLLLNSVLTVKAGQAFSHRGIGWEQFTDAVIEVLNERCENLVFMLWGNAAKAKCAKVDRSRHLVLEAAHPSPLSASRGFFGCRHFSKANSYLLGRGKTQVNWQLPLFVNSIDDL
ncbi:MAG: uracil-DNA glycosylase [Proteobacteria bacterium]|uniref:Uracil-DNA glycosylase n=1 Tax=Candidatus Avisuccinivibrio stercorigallinarum TaxID=2840704 RepID=A0A9D9DFC6_9GAMM|nr:uracil-DNA glycosylase [Candidatus Avisuccinivibrio stercorigallinarum]